MSRGSPGLYQPDDLMWRVNREAVLLLSGPRALLMQVAHPLVAAGVAEHSDFRKAPLGRLTRTLDAMLGMIYGSHDEAQACAERVNRAHASVRGELAVATEAFPAATAYAALDPALLFWVQATLIDSAVAAYESFIAPLSPDQHEALYQESKAMAPLLRLAVDQLPADYEGFRERIDETLAGPTLEITPAAREIADAVLHPRLFHLPRGLWRAGSVLALGLLPAPLRERYGFRWGVQEQRRWRFAQRTIRGSLPFLPSVARTFPRARRAEAERRRTTTRETIRPRSRS